MAGPRGLSYRLSRLPCLLRPSQPRRHASSPSQSPYQPQSRPPPNHNNNTRPLHDPHALLATPTWSIRSLIPPSPESKQQDACQRDRNEPKGPRENVAEEEEGGEEEEITPSQLSHLLRLSALPQPTTPEQTARLLATLRAQLHFVRDVQRVDTRGVQPLASIRDETAEGLREATITVETVRAALAAEEAYGRCRRPRRRRRRREDAAAEGRGAEDQLGKEKKGKENEVELEGGWDPLSLAQEKVGRYFVVRTGDGKADEQTDETDAGAEGRM